MEGVCLKSNVGNFLLLRCVCYWVLDIKCVNQCDDELSVDVMLHIKLQILSQTCVLRIAIEYTFA